MASKTLRLTMRMLTRMIERIGLGDAGVFVSLPEDQRPTNIQYNTVHLEIILCSVVQDIQDLGGSSK